MPKQKRSLLAPEAAGLSGSHSIFESLAACPAPFASVVHFSSSWEHSSQPGRDRYSSSARAPFFGRFLPKLSASSTRPSHGWPPAGGASSSASASPRQRILRPGHSAAGLRQVLP